VLREREGGERIGRKQHALVAARLMTGGVCVRGLLELIAKAMTP
jgi:hypothetical protein